ncbi:MAG: hypothetical protein ACFE85_08880 [Candidatus Hodarchaeota archaeon]
MYSEGNDKHIKKVQRDLIIEGFLNLIILFSTFFLEKNIFARGNLTQIAFDLIATLIPAVLLIIAGLFSKSDTLNKIFVGAGIYITIFNILLNLLLPLSSYAV